MRSRVVQAHNAPTTTMVVDASGALVATASAAHEIRVWDVPGGFCTHSFAGHTGLVLSVLFHSRELILASAGDDGAVILWDLVTKKKRTALRGHVSAVTALCWSRDEWHLLSAGRDQTVVVWDVRTHEKVRVIAVFDSVEALAMVPPGAPVPGLSQAIDPQKAMFFITGGESGELKVWDGRTGRCVHTHKRAAGGAFAREVAAILPMQRARGVTVATADCHIAAYALTGKHLLLKQTLLGNADQVTALRFVGTPAHAAPAQARLQPRVSASGAVSGDLAPRPASLPPRIVLATNSDLVHVLSTTNMSCERTLSGHKDTVLTLAVVHVPAHDCWLVASAGKDKTLRLWHLESGKCLAIGSGHLSALNTVAFAAKAAPFVVTGGADKLVRVWDASAAWDAIGGTASNGAANGAEPRKPAKLKVTATVAGHEKEVNCVAVAPNNRFVASGGADRAAKVWQLPALAAPLTLRGHKRGVMDICFAPLDQVRLSALLVLQQWTGSLCHRCLHASVPCFRAASDCADR
jgi:U3 small nucleolar RNA-associated protein 13